MNDPKPPDGKAATPADARAARVAAALRENLRRRKAAGRPGDPKPPTDATPEG